MVVNLFRQLITGKPTYVINHDEKIVYMDFFWFFLDVWSTFLFVKICMFLSHLLI
ncbi:MAG: hypothetical protein Q8778_02410 [Sweet potato little leaf phytoplasma]|nr:hypothetical protein [Sweet potato little leaf phytoplasma]